MLQLDEDIINARYPIKSYTDQSVTVGNATYTKSLIVSADTLIPNWRVDNRASLDEKSLQLALALHPEILIIGTGREFHRLPLALAKQCKAANTAVETMTTAAACRSYTALLGESRRVAVALIIEKELS